MGQFNYIEASTWQKLTFPDFPVDKEQSIGATIKSISEKRWLNTITLLAGEAGTGKTYFVNHIVRLLDEDIIAKRNFLSPSSQGVPYAVIREVLENLLEELLETNSNKEISKKFIDAFGTRQSELEQILPSVGRLNKNSSQASSISSPESLKNRTLNVLSDFTEWVLFELNKPVCILLDNFEWADASSIEIIEQCSSNGIKGLHFVLTYNESNLPGLNTFKNGAFYKKGAKYNLHNLSLTGAGEILVELIDGEISDEIITNFYLYSKGSFYTFFELISNCVIENRLIPSKVRDKWIWTELEETQISELLSLDSILDLKLGSLSEENQDLLAYAACFGHNLNSIFIGKITNTPISVVKKCFQEAQTLNLVNQGVTKNASIVSEKVHFQFINKYVQNYFKERLSEEQQKETHGKISEYLTSGSLIGLHERDLFDATFHINQAISTYSSSKYQQKHFALNLKAMLRAKSLASYKLSNSYLQECLKNDLSNWNTDHNNCYQLHFHGYSIALLNENQELSDELYAKCKSHAKGMNLYELEAEKLQLEVQFGKLDEAIQTGTKLLAKLGYPVKRKFGKAYLIKEVLSTHLQIRNVESEYIENLPEVTNPKTILAFEVFQRMYRAAYYIIPELNAILAMKSLRIMLKEGVSHSSYAHLLAYSILIGVSNDNIELSNKFNKLSKEIANKFKVDTGVYIFGQAITDAFRMPLRKTLRKYYTSIKKSYEEGDYFSSTEPTVNLSLMHLCAGLPLTEVVYKANQNKTLCFELGNKDYFEFQKVFIHGIENIIGMRNQDAPEEIKYILKNSQYSLTNTIHKITNVINLCHSRCWGEAYKISKGMHQESQFATGLFIQFDFYLYNVIAGLMTDNLSTLQRITLNRKVKATYKKLSRWSKVCPENHEHNIALLIGAIAYRKGQTELALTTFEKAYQLAEKNHFLNKQSLARLLKYEAAVKLSHQDEEEIKKEMISINQVWKS